MSDSSVRPIGLLLSGGLDSAILLGRMLEQGRRVQPFYIRSGLVWESAELAAVRRLLTALATERLEPLVVLEQPLRDIYGDHWSVTGDGTPDEFSPDEAVYLPGRNLMLAMKAAVWCRLHGIDRLALAVLRGNPFSDATAAFFRNLEATLSRALGDDLRILRPLEHLDKSQVMRLGRDLPLGWTFSCIAPVGRLHCGRCNKCAERAEAFRIVGADDPTHYAYDAAVTTDS